MKKSKEHYEAEMNKFLEENKSTEVFSIRDRESYLNPKPTEVAPVQIEVISRGPVYRFFAGLAMFFIMTFFRSLYINLTVKYGQRGDYYSPLYKLLSGATMLWLCYFFVSHEGTRYMEQEKYNGFLIGVANLVMLIWFVKGMYRVGTFYYFNPTFESGPGGEVIEKSYQSNVDSMISYRESKMSNMTPAEASDFLVATSGLDAIKNGKFSGPNAESAASFAESKLSNMTPEQGMDYFSKKK